MMSIMFALGPEPEWQATGDRRFWRPQCES